MRLGRLPHDPVAVAAAPRHVMAAAAPVPPVLNRLHLPYQPGLYRNDTLGDCTAAGMANALTAFGLVRAGITPLIAPDKVVQFYADCVGNPPDLAATDGAVELDVLRRANTQGVDFGQQVPFVPTYAACDPADRAQIAHVTLANGCAYLGIDLTRKDMDTLSAGGVWDDDGSDASPVIGGHCLLTWDYLGLNDADIVRLATWGALVPATWRWLSRRLQEAWAVAWPQLAGPSAS